MDEFIFVRDHRLGRVAPRSQEADRMAPSDAAAARVAAVQGAQALAAAGPNSLRQLQRSIGNQAVIQLMACRDPHPPKLEVLPGSAISSPADSLQRAYAEGADITVEKVTASLKGKVPPTRIGRLAKWTEETDQVFTSVAEAVEAAVGYNNPQVPVESMEAQQRRLKGTPLLASYDGGDVHEGHLEKAMDTMPGKRLQVISRATEARGTTWEVQNVKTTGRGAFSYHVHPDSFGTKWIPGAEMTGGHQNGTRQTPQTIVDWLNAKHKIENYKKEIG